MDSENSGQPNPMNAGYFQRWYDMDVQLSELVYALESLTEESQLLFAFLTLFFADEIVRVKGHAFFSELEWDKLMGIYKSKRGRRWYDQQNILHKAFNKLYSLSETDQAAIASQLHIPVRMVKRYETRCQEQQQPPMMDMICTIIETTFTQGPQAAQEQFGKL